MDIDHLVAEPWDELALYTLSEVQIQQLLKHPALKTRNGWAPPWKKFVQYTQGKPQILLVTRGTINHVSGNLSYTQMPNDILVIPSHFTHQSTIGSEELEYILIAKDMN